MSRYDNIDLLHREIEQCRVALEEADRRWLLTDNGKLLKMAFDLPEVERMYPQAKVQLIQNTALYLQYILSDEKSSEITIQKILHQEIDIEDMKTKNFSLFSERLKKWIAWANIVTWWDLLWLEYERRQQQHTLWWRNIWAKSFSDLNIIVFEKTWYKLDEKHDISQYLCNKGNLS